MACGVAIAAAWALLPGWLLAMLIIGCLSLMGWLLGPDYWDAEMEWME